MRIASTVALILAGTLAVGAAPMQCPATDREPPPTVPEAPEECYLLAERLRASGDLAGWRTALEYVLERFPDSRYAARARDDLQRGPAPPPGADASSGPP